MKCPKCDYISFDYNQTCPNCTRDLSDERARMNLPSFKPNPPFALRSLTNDPDTPDNDQPKTTPRRPDDAKKEVELNTENFRFIEIAENLPPEEHDIDRFISKDRDDPGMGNHPEAGDSNSSKQTGELTPNMEGQEKNADALWKDVEALSLSMEGLADGRERSQELREPKAVRQQAENKRTAGEMGSGEFFPDVEPLDFKLDEKE